MRLGVWGWSAIVLLVVMLLAGVAIRRPLVKAMTGDYTAAEADAMAAAKQRVRWQAVAAGFQEPVDMQFVPGSEGQAVILEKTGRARLLQLRLPATNAPASVGAEPPASPGPDVFTVPVRSSSELGLLGLAFHPKYRENGLFYVNDNPKEGALRTRISEWRLPLEEMGKKPAELVRVLLEIEQPYQNHDGGQVAFGPDGYLYIGMGDGGSRNDPHGHGQNMGSLLGKMLRIDVDAQPSYGIPSDNPFVNVQGTRPEIWASGLRNPWRFTFDPMGRMIAADVGQDSWEEVDIIAKGDNLGWNTREAAHCFSPRENCPTANLVDPIFEYDRDAGQSITGGQVYLGNTLPFLRNKYLCGDFVSGRVWAVELPERTGKLVEGELLGKFEHAFSSFARDGRGELYALDFARGLVLQLAGGS